MQHLEIPVMAECHAKGKQPEYLYWVGCAGAFDDRYRKVSQAFAKILHYLNTDFAVLGPEESCTGDPARRAGNEMLYQMQAMQNIGLFRKYGIRKIITTCPHCYNIFLNEYPDLGADFEVIHYTAFLYSHRSRLKPERINRDRLKKMMTYHDPCYLGRANNIYEEPRMLMASLEIRLTEMKRHRSHALCCGAGGAQMFKEAETGNKEVFIERIEDVIETLSDTVVTACPFCMTMLTDGIKYKNREHDLNNLDIAELVAMSLGI